MAIAEDKIPDGQWACELTGVKAGYGSTPVLDGISLQVPRGTVFGLLGPNGAGKTTAIRLLTGRLRPWEGRVLVLGQDVSEAGNSFLLRSQVGWLPDEAGHYKRLSVRRNLEFFVQLYGKHADARSRAEELLKAVHLEDKADASADSLSRGMRQRLGLARSLAGDPQLLFLDEPTAGLDPIAAREVRKLIKAFCEKGGSVFLTTHYMEEAEDLCANVALLDNGKVICSGHPLDLCARHLPAQVEVEKGNRKVMTAPGLEQLFYSLTGRSVN